MVDTPELNELHAARAAADTRIRELLELNTEHRERIAVLEKICSAMEVRLKSAEESDTLQRAENVKVVAKKEEAEERCKGLEKMLAEEKARQPAVPPMNNAKVQCGK